MEECKGKASSDALASPVQPTQRKFQRSHQVIWLVKLGPCGKNLWKKEMMVWGILNFPKKKKYELDFILEKFVGGGPILKVLVFGEMQ